MLLRKIVKPVSSAANWLAIAAIFAAVTFGLSFIRRYKWIKYLPSLAALMYAIYLIILVNVAPGEGFLDIGRILLAIMLLAGAFGGAVTGFLIDRVFNKRGK